MKLLRLAIAGLVGGVAAQDVITDDTYFYGQSPPVYPSPKMDGTGEWAAAYQRAKTLVADMTLEEKVRMPPPN
ncbi:putative beta-glucosidase M [Escovopsis weberi]|uniref:Putative beta-glucosidase M n=1 Tax=Escovopsis weberi TaxID=150374 RepID=A0A0M8N9Y0_ESCWE|nr:putative beta-glucosidase M [Escovopsis weberi]